MDGDQIFAYTGSICSNAALVYPWRGDPAAATMIYGINFANGGWDNVTGGEPTTSFIPSGLSVSASTAVHIDSLDNGYYSGIRVGTAEELLQAIANPANWTTSNDPYDPTNWPAAFRVLTEGSIFTLR